MTEPLKVLKGKRWPWDFRPDTLSLFEDRMVYENKGLIASNESTIPYGQVAQVNLHKGLMRSTLELVNTGGAQNIKVQNIPNAEAQQAKALIEQKMSGVG